MVMPDLAERTEARVQKAVRDLESRTLARMPGDIAKLVYLSSTRDFNTGSYHHDGLIMSYNAEVAAAALARCHEKTFQTVVRTSLAQVVESLHRYFETTGEPHGRVLQVWQKLQGYHVLIPATCDAMSAELFVSNVKMALAILNHRHSLKPSRREAAQALPQPQ